MIKKNILSFLLALVVLPLASVHATTPTELANEKAATIALLERSEARVKDCYYALGKLFVENHGRFLNEYIQLNFNIIQKHKKTVTQARETITTLTDQTPTNDTEREALSSELLIVRKKLEEAYKQLSDNLKITIRAHTLAYNFMSHIDFKDLGRITRQEGNIASQKEPLIVGLGMTALLTPLFTFLLYKGNDDSVKAGALGGILALGGLLGSTKLLLMVLNHVRNRYKKYAEPLTEILDELGIDLNTLDYKKERV